MRNTRFTIIQKYPRRTTIRVFFDRQEILSELFLIVEQYSWRDPRLSRNTVGVILDRREILSELFSIVEKYSRSNYLGVILDRREILSECFLIIGKHSQSIFGFYRNNLGVILVFHDDRESLQEYFLTVENHSECFATIDNHAERFLTVEKYS